MTLLMLLACTGEEIEYSDFTSRDTDVTLEPTSEPSGETGLEETGDTEEPVEVNPEITFRTPVMSCSDLQLRTMTFTRVFPDGLNVQGESDAIFYEEMMRQDLSDSSIVVQSIAASEDTVLSQERYEAGAEKLPADTEWITIEGGNNAQFGDYGVQDGDGEASISPEAQWGYTTDSVLSLYDRLD